MREKNKSKGVKIKGSKAGAECKNKSDGGGDKVRRIAVSETINCVLQLLKREIASWQLFEREKRGCRIDHEEGRERKRDGKNSTEE